MYNGGEGKNGMRLPIISFCCLGSRMTQVTYTLVHLINTWSGGQKTYPPQVTSLVITMEGAEVPWYILTTCQDDAEFT